MDTLIVERLETGVVVVTLDRPDQRNAFDKAMMDELTQLWEILATGPSVRCLVMTGTDPAFCAGADMELLKYRASAGATVSAELAFLPGNRLKCPVIAAVNGVCAGGGLHFVADADIVVASEQATFLDPHVSVGQVTALESLPLLLRARWDVVTRMALLGRHERLDAAQAQDAGLVSEVIPHESLLEHVIRLAELIASNSPAAVARSREVLRNVEHELIGSAMEQGWTSIKSHWTHPDSKEGPAAFTERREPEWSDRP